MIFIKKGDPSLTKVQAEVRARRVLDSQISPWKREKGAFKKDATYLAEAAMLWEDSDTSLANNDFNIELKDYRKASKRLAKYKLSDGRAEVTEQVDTGTTDGEGNPVLKVVVVSKKVDPVDATVDKDTFDQEGVKTGTEKVANPVVVKDMAERAEAKAVIDATPQAVKDY